MENGPPEDEKAMPLCVRCLQPLHGNPYYCPHCGHVANTLTPYLPFVEIPFYTRFIADSFRLIRVPGTSPFFRAAAMIGVFVLLGPILPILLVI